MKARGLRPRAFICFSVFGTRDEALALVFDILLEMLVLAIRPWDWIESWINFVREFRRLALSAWRNEWSSYLSAEHNELILFLSIFSSCRILYSSATCVFLALIASFILIALSQKYTLITMDHSTLLGSPVNLVPLLLDSFLLTECWIILVLKIELTIYKNSVNR